jgi:hypothetical protein
VLAVDPKAGAGVVAVDADVAGAANEDEKVEVVAPNGEAVVAPKGLVVVDAAGCPNPPNGFVVVVVEMVGAVKEEVKLGNVVVAVVAPNGEVAGAVVVVPKPPNAGVGVAAGVVVAPNNGVAEVAAEGNPKPVVVGGVVVVAPNGEVNGVAPVPLRRNERMIEGVGRDEGVLVAESAGEALFFFPA